MSRIEKLILKFLKNPQSLKYKKIEKILLHYGFKKTGVKGSHHQFFQQLIKLHLVLPVHNNDCKESYKKTIVKLIEKNFNSHNHDHETVQT